MEYNGVDPQRDEEYSEAFHYFAKNGRLGTSELKELLKYLGYNPSDGDIREAMKGIIGDAIDYGDFVNVLKFLTQSNGGNEELIQAFRVFDRTDSGYISAAEFKHLMTTLGDKFSEDEIEEMLREAEIDAEGLINYREFVQTKMSN